ncbi:hypothetical protein ACFZDK_06710 [Streptomyces sp. NPDC007901]|uniref:hypothetical protein n=1 Tax=Streptomyces sp. NPDC007901 TaxID=3364785 RepID=UPI0036E3F87B
MTQTNSDITSLSATRSLRRSRSRSPSARLGTSRSVSRSASTITSSLRMVSMSSRITVMGVFCLT